MGHVGVVVSSTYPRQQHDSHVRGRMLMETQRTPHIVPMYLTGMHRLRRRGSSRLGVLALQDLTSSSRSIVRSRLNLYLKLVSI